MVVDGSGAERGVAGDAACFGLAEGVAEVRGAGFRRGALVGCVGSGAALASGVGLKIGRACAGGGSNASCMTGGVMASGVVLAIGVWGQWLNMA